MAMLTVKNVTFDEVNVCESIILKSFEFGTLKSNLKSTPIDFMSSDKYCRALLVSEKGVIDAPSFIEYAKLDPLILAELRKIKVEISDFDEWGKVSEDQLEFISALKGFDFDNIPWWKLDFTVLGEWLQRSPPTKTIKLSEQHLKVAEKLYEKFPDSWMQFHYNYRPLGLQEYLLYLKPRVSGMAQQVLWTLAAVPYSRISPEIKAILSESKASSEYGFLKVILKLKPTSNLSDLANLAFTDYNPSQLASDIIQVYSTLPKPARYSFVNLLNAKLTRILNQILSKDDGIVKMMIDYRLEGSGSNDGKLTMWNPQGAALVNYYSKTVEWLDDSKLKLFFENVHLNVEFILLMHETCHCRLLKLYAKRVSDSQWINSSGQILSDVIAGLSKFAMKGLLSRQSYEGYLESVVDVLASSASLNVFDSMLVRLVRNVWGDAATFPRPSSFTHHINSLIHARLLMEDRIPFLYSNNKAILQFLEPIPYTLADIDHPQCEVDIKLDGFVEDLLVDDLFISHFNPMSLRKQPVKMDLSLEEFQCVDHCLQTNIMTDLISCLLLTSNSENVFKHLLVKKIIDPLKFYKFLDKVEETNLFFDFAYDPQWVYGILSRRDRQEKYDNTLLIYYLIKGIINSGGEEGQKYIPYLFGSHQEALKNCSKILKETVGSMMTKRTRYIFDQLELQDGSSIDFHILLMAFDYCEKRKKTVPKKGQTFF